MKVEFKYCKEQRVRIRAIDIIGRVDALMDDRDGLQYRVVFWNNNERHSYWLYDWEIDDAR